MFFLREQHFHIMAYADRGTPRKLALRGKLTMNEHSPIAPGPETRRAPDARVAPALFADLYELTMLEAYLAEDMHEDAVFGLFVRRLPPRRNFLLACGLDPVLDYLETVRFEDDDIAYLDSLGRFSQRCLDWLRAFRFTGDVYAVPEGTPIFANEPILEVVAPITQGQLVETFVMNQVHLQTVLASKAARVVAAARGRPVIDFGARRMHGIDAAQKAARAFFIAGVSATSNVLAGKEYGVPVAGTMAHSYIQAHDDEASAFSAFARVWPETVILVDTYDSLDGVRKAIELARSSGAGFRVKAVRLDSGDLAELARQARGLLDRAGLQDVQIFVSGGLDEDAITAALASGAPIDAFGVGTKMGLSSDHPDLDIAYKLCEYGGKGRLKLSTGKPILPGRKQVFRFEADGVAVRDVIGRAEESLPGRPLLRPVMRSGRRLPEGCGTLEEARDRARDEIARLPAQLRSIEPCDPPYLVEVSQHLRDHSQRVEEAVARSQERVHTAAFPVDDNVRR
jgi:nicotinate phosphoribosyltransferase